MRVTLVNPGMVRTPFFDDLPIAPGPDPEHALEAEDVAAAMAFVLGLPPHAVVESIDLGPLTRVVRKQHRG